MKAQNRAGPATTAMARKTGAVHLVGDEVYQPSLRHRGRRTVSGPGVPGDGTRPRRQRRRIRLSVVLGSEAGSAAVQGK